MLKWFSTPPPCKNGELKRVPVSSFTAPTSPSIWDIMAMFFSLVPLFIVVCLCIFAAYTRQFRQSVVWTAFFFMHFPITELLKIIIRQRRPEGSCNLNFGMPSGHSFAALSVLVFALFRFRFSPVLLGLAILMLAPVPWARVQLRDHSVAQAAVGGVLGATWGLVWVRFQSPLIKWLARRFYNSKQPRSPPSCPPDGPVIGAAS